MVYPTPNIYKKCKWNTPQTNFLERGYVLCVVILDKKKKCLPLQYHYYLLNFFFFKLEGWKVVLYHYNMYDIIFKTSREEWLISLSVLAGMASHTKTH